MSVMPGLPELCLLAALYLGASSEKLTARVWQPSRPDFQLPESFEGSLNPGWSFRALFLMFPYCGSMGGTIS